jgi:hypothetical protein
MTSSDSQAAQGASTLMEALDAAQAAGFTEQFIATADGDVRCGACPDDIPADRLIVHHQDRLEGASDTADEMLVARVECAECGARGTLVLGYGPNASEADVEVLRRLPESRD